MSETIEVEVGGLYAEMHEQYDGSLEDQYTQRLRAQVEDFLHQFNQQVERQQEQMAAQQGDTEGEELDLGEEELEAVAASDE